QPFCLLHSRILGISDFCRGGKHLQTNASRTAISVPMDLSATDLLETDGTEPTKRLAQRLGSLIADAADADQWAIAVDGLGDLQSAAFAELVPRCWLVALNGGREAVYDVALPLGPSRGNLGLVRLATIRPCGFDTDQVIRAQAAANWAAEVLRGELS